MSLGTIARIILLLLKELNRTPTDAEDVNRQAEQLAAKKWFDEWIRKLESGEMDPLHAERRLRSAHKHLVALGIDPDEIVDAKGTTRARQFLNTGSLSPQDDYDISPERASEGTGLHGEPVNRGYDQTESSLRTGQLTEYEVRGLLNKGVLDAKQIEAFFCTAARIGSRRLIEDLEARGYKWPMREPDLQAFIKMHIRDQDYKFAEYLFERLVAYGRETRTFDKFERALTGMVLEFPDPFAVIALLKRTGLLNEKPRLLKSYLSVRGSYMSSSQLAECLSIFPEAIDGERDGTNSLIASAYAQGRYMQFETLLEFGASLSSRVQSVARVFSNDENGDRHVLILNPILPEQAVGMTVAEAILKYGPDEYRSLVGRYQSRVGTGNS
jgi:hypothetical protein